CQRRLRSVTLRQRLTRLRDMADPQPTLVELLGSHVLLTREFLPQIGINSCVPLWLSDGFKGSRPAILGHCGVWHQPERKRAQGPAPKPRWMPQPGLLYAQVIKQYRRKRMIGVRHYVVFGTLGAIEQVLAGCGWKINTAFVERLNLDIRQRVAAVGRRVNTLCQGKAS